MYAGTTTALGGAATYTSMVRMANRDDSINGTVSSDQSGTLFIEQTYDKLAADPATASTATWDVSTSYAVTGGDGKGFTELLVAPYWRLRYLNGAVSQTTFRLHGRTMSGGDS